MPTTQGYDPGFVGAAYEAPNYLQDTQRCINWYPEISPDPHAKEVISLMGAPGTLDLVTLLLNKPVRQAWVMPGGTRVLAVAGPNVYLVTQDALANLSAVQVGTLLTPIGPVQIRDNGYVAVIVDGAYGYTYLMNTGAFAQITDPGFTGFASRVAMIDGWFIFNQANSRNFYISPQYLGINGNVNQGLQNTPWDATQFAVADATGDLLVSLIEDQRLIWLPKERATEVWYDAGAQFFTFNRMQGVLLQIGCAAPQSVARVSKGLMWLAANERGQNFVIRTQGFDYDRVSTHAIDFAISSYAIVSDALGWTYIENGHEFYVLTFPTADVTWVYDTLTGLWHERLSFNPMLGTYHRHRGNCVINFQNRRLIGTWDTGALAWMDRSQVFDGGNPLVSWRRTGHIWDKQSRRRIFHHQLQIETAPGVATSGLPGFTSSSGGGGGGGGGGLTGVIALLHLDGANGSNVFTDVGGSVWSPVNNATLTTSHFKFGNASLDTQLTHYITTPFATQWAFTGDFTVELFAYWNNLSTGLGDSAFVGSGAATPKWVLFQLDTSGHLDFYASIVPGTWGFHVTSSAVVSTGTWHHLAMVRSGSTITCYYDGVSFGSGTLSGTLDNSQGLAIGAIGSVFGQQFDGYIDEVRLSNIAQYMGNFTPPTQPFGSPVFTAVKKPQMILKWSDDGGKTFGNEKQLPMGQIGQFKNRSVAYNLGYSRDRVYDLKVIDAVPRDLIGATLMSETEI
jgi:Concanavalin A-like lectin/glucanases superfamily